MVQGKHFLSRLLQALLLFGVAALLTACAGRPKPLDATTPFTITEVRVTTQSMADFGFADRLQRKLEATAGRATSDAGLASILRVVVVDRNTEAGQIWLFNDGSQTATLDLVVIDARTGQILKNSVVHVRAASRSESVLIEKLAADVRALLGLSGAAPYPVGGAKRMVAWPQLRADAMGPDDSDLSDPALLSADPLLNGTVTPTSLNLNPMPETGAEFDLSRPLLSMEPEQEQPKVPEAEVEEAIAPESVNIPRTFELPPAALAIPDAPAAAATGEPCVITLDNDCSDPDGR